MCDEGNISLILSLHLTGHSNKVDQQEVIITLVKSTLFCSGLCPSNKVLR